MIEVENDQAIDFIKKNYQEYLNEELKQQIQQYDLLTNSLIGCMIASIVSAVIYGYTKNVLFIVLVGVLLCCGIFCSARRKVMIKQIVKKVNQEIKKK